MATASLAPPASSFSVGPVNPPPTSRRHLDEMLARLREGAAGFVRWSIPERIRLIREMQIGMLAQADAMVWASCEAKGIPARSPLAGDEWATGPWPVVRQLRLLAKSLEQLASRGTTPLGKVSRTAAGQLVAQVFPTSRIDGVLFSGITTEVRFQPGWSERALEGRGVFYHGRPHDGRTVLILGAGNLAAIPAMDVVTKLFNEGKACLLKMNPVNAYLGPILERAFAAAIRHDVLRIAYGGAAEGEYVVNHQDIQEIHLTGSDQTYDRICWGPPGAERERRKARNEPLIRKPFTAELGNVSPVIVVPGPYRRRELAFQAAGIAGAFTSNASFDCCTPRVIVTARGWSDRGPFLDGLAAALRSVAPRHAYYPGAAQRWGTLARGRSQLRTLGEVNGGALPWTLLPALDATDPEEPAFRHEAFCCVLSETEVASDDPIEFLERAVDFVNNRLWGTLSADLVVHPRLFKDPRTAMAVERALDRLRYGVVTVNSWTGYAFVQGSPPWGGYPGAEPQDIQSGTGWVHNTSMLEGIEKVVLRHPLTLTPKPVTFPGHRTADQLMRRMTLLEADARWRHVPGVVAAAVRG